VSGVARHRTINIQTDMRIRSSQYFALLYRRRSNYWSQVLGLYIVAEKMRIFVIYLIVTSLISEMC